MRLFRGECHPGEYQYSLLAVWSVAGIVLLSSLIIDGIRESQSGWRQAPSAEEVANSIPSVAPGGIHGNFKPIYEEVSEDFSEIKGKYQEKKLLEHIVADLNKALKLPFDIQVSLCECNGRSAFFSKAERKVAISYAQIEDIFRRLTVEREGEENAPIHVVTYMVYGEIGRALVDLLKLSPTQRLTVRSH